MGFIDLLLQISDIVLSGEIPYSEYSVYSVSALNNSQGQSAIDGFINLLTIVTNRANPVNSLRMHKRSVYHIKFRMRMLYLVCIWNHSSY